MQKASIESEAFLFPCLLISINSYSISMNIFTKIYRFAWVVLVILIIFLDRNNLYWVIGTIILLLLLSCIAVLRFLDSRNEWREIIKDKSLDKDIP